MRTGWSALHVPPARLEVSLKEAPVIAVVDDDVSIRTGVERLLRSAGYGVRLYDSAESFLDSGTTPAPAAVLSDVHMPGMSGLDLQQKLRRDHPGWEVLLMTAYPELVERERALAQGARCLLSKPFDADELLAHLDAVTGGT